MMIMDNKWELGAEVYLKSDDEQLLRIIRRLVVHQGGLRYELICGSDVSEHYDFEITSERNYTTH